MRCSENWRLLQLFFKPKVYLIQIGVGKKVLPRRTFQYLPFDSASRKLKNLHQIITFLKNPIYRITTPTTENYLKFT